MPKCLRHYLCKSEHLPIIFTTLVRVLGKEWIHTRYCSWFRISGNHNKAPSSPDAFQRSNRFLPQRLLWRWNAPSCWRILKCFPISPFLYFTMYRPRTEGMFKPFVEEDCSLTANLCSLALSQAVFVSCQIYLSTPSRIEWRISQGLSWCGSSPQSFLWVKWTELEEAALTSYMK